MQLVSVRDCAKSDAFDKILCDRMKSVNFQFVRNCSDEPLEQVFALKGPIPRCLTESIWKLHIFISREREENEDVEG